MKGNLSEALQAWLSGALGSPPIARFLGMRLLRCADGSSVMEMDAGPAHHNPMGVVHGGILCDLADAAMGTAVASTLHEQETFATLDLTAHFLAPVLEGRLVAEAKVVRRGRTTAYVECEVKGDAGKLIAKACSTCLILAAEPSPSAEPGSP